MKRHLSLTLGRTEVVLHASLLLYAGYACLCGKAAFFAASTLSILLHEGAHALAGAAMGQPPERIELTPLGAVLRVEDDAKLSPGRRALMLLAGPGMTLLVCGAAILLTRAGLVSVAWGHRLFVSNVSILLVNLLPALQLDGGRLLLLALEHLLPLRTAQRLLRGIGSAISMGLIGLNLCVSWRMGGWNLSLAFAGCCLLYGSAASLTTRAMAEYRFLLERKILLEQKGCLPAAVYAALPAQTLRQLVRQLPRGRMCHFVCYEAGSMRLMGVLTEPELLRQYFSAPERPLGEAVRLINGEIDMI